LEANPGHVLALKARSDAYRSLKDLPAALADAERMIAALPRSALGYCQKSWVYGSLHDEEGALEAASRAIEMDPTNGDGQFNRALVHDSRGALDDVIADLTRAIELNPTEVRYSYRASTHYRNGEYELAIADYKRSIDLDSDHLRAYRGMFWAHWNAGRRDEARAALEQVSKRAETWVQEEGLVGLHDAWVDYYRLTGDYERALAEAEKIIELWPERVRGYWRRAQLRRDTEGQAGIAEDCDLMAGLDLDQPAEVNSRANTMRDFCQRPEQALADYGLAIELAPSWAEPYYGRALLHEARTDLERALTDMKKAVDVAPNWTDAKVSLARLQTRVEEER
jgi:tetratricopeptide (TPR) repeat protein